MNTTERASKSSGRRYSVAELFCGCGGFSRGFWRTRAYEIVLGVDIKPEALDTFRRNHLTKRGGAPEIILGDIRSIGIADIKSSLEKRGVKDGKLDCLIGGPPCQGFSQLRRSEEREHNKIVRYRGYNKLDQDPRNDLVLRFLEIAAALRPKVIVIENVPQMMRHHHRGIDGGIAAQIKALLGEMQYSVVEGVLNAADFGVPQLRERAFIIASRVGKPQLPIETHADPAAGSMFTKRLLPWVSAGDAICDLPPPSEAPLDSHGGGPVSLYLQNVSAYAKHMRSKRQFPYNHVTRPYTKAVVAIIQSIKAGENWDDASARMRAKYERLIEAETREGETAGDCRKRLIAEGCIVPAFYKKYYWSAYTRIEPERPALTITANANFLGSGQIGRAHV